MTPRILSVESLLNGWLDHAFACYDFTPMKPGKRVKLRHHAYELGAELIIDDVSADDAVQQMFNYLDNIYVVFHAGPPKRLMKSPCMMSCKKASARRLADWVAS